MSMLWLIMYVFLGLFSSRINAYKKPLTKANFFEFYIWKCSVPTMRPSLSQTIITNDNNVAHLRALHPSALPTLYPSPPEQTAQVEALSSAQMATWTASHKRIQRVDRLQSFTSSLRTWFKWAQSKTYAQQAHFCTEALIRHHFDSVRVHSGGKLAALSPTKRSRESRERRRR